MWEAVARPQWSNNSLWIILAKSMNCKFRSPSPPTIYRLTCISGTENGRHRIALLKNVGSWTCFESTFLMSWFKKNGEFPATVSFHFPLSAQIPRQRGFILVDDTTDHQPEQCMLRNRHILILVDNNMLQLRSKMMQLFRLIN